MSVTRAGRSALVCVLFAVGSWGCGSDSGASSSTIVANGNSSADGTWTGTWLSHTGVGGDVVLVISGGSSSVTGSVSFTSSPCFSSGAIAGTVSGDAVTGALTAGAIDVTFDTTITGTMMSGTYDAVSAGACTGDTGTLSLTK